MATHESTQVNEPIVTDNSKSEEKDNSQDEKSEVSAPTTDTEAKATNESASSEPVSSKEENKTDESFQVEKESGKKLTDFQQKKAKYFFNVNLDIENKGFVTWEDVDFYLLFHATAAGKEGSNGGDIEARLNRATRALWDFIHDQVPSKDGDKNQLSLEQALDTWASLSDFVEKHDRLPSILEDWIKVGFELYSEDNPDAKTKTVSLSAFDELFQKMNLGRPYAIMAFKILTQHGSVSLDYEKIQSIVKSLITSSDDDHESHFILPGFFKTITNGSNKSSPSEKASEEDKLSTTSKEEPKESEISSTTDTKEEKTPSPKPVENNEEKLNSSSRSETPKTKQTQQTNRHSPQPTFRRVRQDDDGIRQLLKFYNIDDGDVVEVNDGPAKRVVTVHPERPVTRQNRQNQQIPNKIKTASSLTSSGQQLPTGSQKPISNEQQIPTNRARPTRAPFGADIRAPSHTNQYFREAPVAPNSPGKTAPTNGQTQEKPKETEEKRGRQISEADEQRLVANIIQQLRPVIEKRVSEELRRFESSENKNKNDDDEDPREGFIPFPFLFPGAVPLFAGPPSCSRSADSSDSSAPKETSEQIQEQAAGIEEMLPGAATFLPPPLLMAMMNDLARVAAGEGPMPDFPLGPGGPMGVEGFMMFVNGEPMMPGGPRGFPPTF